ncbi:MAG TPA: MBL fold metallo-hydrolase [Cyclobacteriaceae bacterium]|nr:MBL fold metallo-hydrolase [Cyclobacteriaceae bacterium]
MKIKIHRGQDQIGGSIVEISTKATKILIDFGEELSPHQKIDNALVLQGCDAVFFSHYHGDHIGLYKSIPLDIPIYLGGTAKQIFAELVSRTERESLPVVGRFSELAPLRIIQIGDIQITPLLTDHSAFDAYMFLVKADGKTILHTGDFRGHGYRSRGLMPTLRKYVGKVDVLITEGTCLSRTDNEVLSERQLQLKATALMHEKNYVFVLCSSTNIERIAAFYHANPRGRYFLCDSYQKNILNIVTEASAGKSSLYDFKKAVIYGDNLEDRFLNRGFCMLVRNRDDHRSIIDSYPPEDRLVIYSMWKGYLAGETQNEKLIQFLNGIDYTYLHTSGHADAQTIESIINEVQPDFIMPIHTENAKWFQEKYPRRTMNATEFNA